MIQQIKYVLVFDERIDKSDIKSHQICNENEEGIKDDFLEEIQEEEKFING